MKTDRVAATTRQEEYRDFQQLREFMRAFEAGSLPKSRWNHAAHLAVAMWYFSLLPERKAAAQVVELLFHQVVHFLVPLVTIQAQPMAGVVLVVVVTLHTLFFDVIDMGEFQWQVQIDRLRLLTRLVIATGHENQCAVCQQN